ncbi:putative membrane protein [Janibacter sp. HTCC2649]|uniref:hypothetical protein n=1 Tax=Janibacter sp. HTCC2649 TaxID=313589 RepID=UPI00006709D6|nr:hypothetical protein [Janibacter sp. HTCC2649]EAQ00916.1 putative membrane protein [Janibacter sp. HTCC2649]
MPNPSTHRRAGRLATLAVAVSATTSFFATAPAGAAEPAPAASPPTPTACPATVADIADCWTGQDSNGAFYAIAVPHEWNRSLLVHAHGGPDLGETSDPSRSVDDLDRWAVMVREGYAWAGSSYRRGGFGTEMAAIDTESVRKIFIDTWGKPRLTLLHGQSWGGDVAAKTAETFGNAADKPYDGVLLTSGVLAGATRGYDYRVDLRAVYQYYCQNHPRPTEVQYPVWMGLRPGSTMTSAGLRSRLQECTGFQSEPTERTPLQQRNLDDILGVTGIPERTLESHLRFATFTFRDIVSTRLGGRNPFSNRSIRYSGSHDDAALNKGVERFSADQSAVRDLSFDSDLTGDVRVPVLTMHAIDDPTAFVEHESAYRATLTAAGNADHLVQTFTHESEHSSLSNSEYATVIHALETWVDTGAKPTPASIANACPEHDSDYSTGCLFDPAFHPGSYASRVNPRPGATRWPALTAGQYSAWDRQGGVGIAP